MGNWSGYGYHWYALGYESLQAFINAMYKDETSQLEAMCRYIKVNGLINALKNKDWKALHWVTMARLMLK